MRIDPKKLLLKLQALHKAQRKDLFSPRYQSVSAQAKYSDVLAQNQSAQKEGISPRLLALTIIAIN
jgi:hypothetical protein